MSQNNFPFRRLTNPLRLTVDTTAQQFAVPPGFFAKGGEGYGCTAFYVVNPNNFYVRLRGSQGSYTAVTATTGWLFPPNFAGVFSTQYPDYMSALSIMAAGLTAGQGILEISYGVGA